MKASKMLQYRNIWMALAILWLICYHAQFNLLPAKLDWLENVGYLGVDIFFFASGIGCYYSLDKNNNILSFLKRRFNRIMPAYFCFIIFWILFKKLTSGITYTEALGNFFGVEFLVNSEQAFNWYISAAWLFYFLAPFFKAYADKNCKLINHIILILFLLLLSVPFWFANIDLIFMTRLPIYYLGFYTAKMAKKGTFFSKRKMLAIITVSIAGSLILLLNYRIFPERLLNGGLFWYPGLLIIPGLCLVVSLISSKIETIIHENIIRKLFEIIGNNTFELYLIHIFIYEGIYRYITSNNIDISGNILNISCFAGIFIGVILLKLLTNPIAKLIFKLEQKL